MGALTSGNVRISLHPGVDRTDIDRLLVVLPDAVAAVRAQAPGSPAARPAATAAQPTAARPTAIAAQSATAGLGAAQLLDSRGRRCPLPILDLARALPGIDTGAELTVLADDPAAASDIAAWCRMRGQRLISQTPLDNGGTAYLVRRLR
jgi:cysteine desulfurase